MMSGAMEPICSMICARMVPSALTGCHSSNCSFPSSSIAPADDIATSRKRWRSCLMMGE
jgi:hypothetical protein